MQELVDYLRAGARAPTLVLPCAPWICDWIVLRTGIDPIADIREPWSEAVVLRRIAGEGGLVAMTHSRLAAAGLRETSEPTEGDVGIVRGGDGETLAIKTAKGWAGKARRRGVIVGQFDMIAAWSVPCPR